MEQGRKPGQSPILGATFDPNRDTNPDSISHSNPDSNPEPGPEATAVPRYLGLDVGSKRIGVAVSDELGLLASAVMTLNRKRNPREDLRSLARMCRKFGCVGIVVGNPHHMSGDASAQGAKIQSFARELAELAGLTLYLWDERLTSRAAHEILYAAGKKREEHKPVVDQVAATLILQSFLDAQRDASRDVGEETV